MNKTEEITWLRRCIEIYHAQMKLNTEMAHGIMLNIHNAQKRLEDLTRKGGENGD